MKSKHILVNLTEEQYAVLVVKARSAGFAKNAEYIRFIILEGDNNGTRL
jgi:hypothetical protein